MRRPLLVILALALVVSAAHAVLAQEAVDRIDLPDGWEGEGITTDGSSLFAGSLANGAIWKADPTTGVGEVLVPGAEGAVSVGMDIAPDGTLWVAGGPTGEIRAYDSRSGELLGTYPVEAGFLNDVAASDEAVYVTDSFMPQVISIPLTGDGPPDPAAVTSIPITGELEYGEGFNANGIVALPAGLVVVHGGLGALYRIDPSTGASIRIETGDTDLTLGDGIEPAGRTLYVVRNRANVVVGLELDDSATVATPVGEATSDDLDVPTTAALIGDDLWAVNARFGTTGDDDQAFWITRLDLASAAD
jgi:sugar lactone lactonase YvrE